MSMFPMTSSYVGGAGIVMYDIIGFPLEYDQTYADPLIGGLCYSVDDLLVELVCYLDALPCLLISLHRLDLV